MELNEQIAEVNETANISNLYVMNDKQQFNDLFVPTKSSKGVWVQFAASGQSSSLSSITPNIQFNQCGPKNFSDVMKNIRFRCQLQIKYTLTDNSPDIPYEYLKDFNYAIKQCIVNINGNVTRTLSPAVLAPIYNNYNSIYAKQGFDNFWGKDNTILISRVVTDDNTCTEIYSVDTPIYHPYLTAPYLGGINNMSVDLQFNFMNLPKFLSPSEDKRLVTPEFTITNSTLYYQTYHTDNELFNIAIPEFEQTIIQVSQGNTMSTISTTDLNSAPMKYFFVALNDYISTSPEYDEGLRITSATLNYNNIYNAVKTNTIAGLYEISKYSGYLRSFSEFAKYQISDVKVGDKDLPAPDYSSNDFTYNPQCIAVDITSLDIDTGTTDIFRFDGNFTFENLNKQTVTTIHYIAAIRCYYSLFSSSKIQTNIIKADSLTNRQLDIEHYAYGDYIGFGFFDKLKNGIKNTYKWLKKNKPITKVLNVATPIVDKILPNAAPVVNTIKSVSDTLGFGTVAF
jgi:hypothetical protein